MAFDRSGALELALPQWTDNVTPIEREHVKTMFTPQVRLVFLVLFEVIRILLLTIAVTTSH